MEKQQKIVEMAKDICRHQKVCNDVCKPISACDALRYAERAVEAGYVKQKEGEWIKTFRHSRNWDDYFDLTCPECGTKFRDVLGGDLSKYRYCSVCGLKMKGGDPMREILFRGKSYDGEWVEGAYYKQTEYYGDAFEAHYIISSSDELEDNMMIYDRVIPKTVGQYTGLTDKNGKKIFEGDIVEPPTRVYSRNTRYEVCFDEDRRGWYPFACGDGCGCCESEVESPLSCEVIGNIHDNPDLLKGGDGK